MRGAGFSLLCSALMLAQDAAAVHEALASPGHSKWVLRGNGSSRYACKCYPGDACWPAAGQWQKLNTTVGGHLFVDVPPGAPCHNTFQGPLGNLSTYNANQCASVTANWKNGEFHIGLPAAGLWNNHTCRPTTNPSDTCTLGDYPVMGIMAQTVAHVQAGVNFARTNNLRLVIRNTGHDFLGRSAGWGAFVINTHSLQKVAFTNAWSGPGGYTGSAVTVGAGVQAFTILKQLNAMRPPNIVVTGECATVGLAGGLVQGGGHGPLTNLYGFLADTALAFKAVTADGVLRRADAQNNPDLFWALKGGGPAMAAVIVEATYKTFKDQPSSGTLFDIDPSVTTNNATLFWEAVRVFHSYSTHFVDNGLYVYWALGTAGHNLHVHPIVGIGMTPSQLQAVVQPMLDGLASLGITPNVTNQSFRTFYDLYEAQFEGEAAGNSLLMGGWTIGRDDVTDNNTAIVSAFQTVLGEGFFVVGHMWNAGHGLPPSRWADSAVNPRFRNVASKIITAMPIAGDTPLADKAAAQDRLTNVVDAALRNAAPKGCAYVNEADPYQPNWQNAFWGTNYPALLKIRQKYDPNGVFYAVSTPGTENWVQIEKGTRLCLKV